MKAMSQSTGDPLRVTTLRTGGAERTAALRPGGRDAAFLPSLSRPHRGRPNLPRRRSLPSVVVATVTVHLRPSACICVHPRETFFCASRRHRTVPKQARTEAATATAATAPLLVPCLALLATRQHSARSWVAYHTSLAVSASNAIGRSRGNPAKPRRRAVSSRRRYSTIIGPFRHSSG